MTTASAHFNGGFADPVFAAQTTFRAVLDALARPGTPVSCIATTKPPKPLAPLAGDILCTLADADTQVFFSPCSREPGPAQAWLRFQSGAAVTRDASEAAFAVATDATTLPSLSQFAQGTAEYPDRSTTLVIQVESLEGGNRKVELSGPGIKDKRVFGPRGLTAAFWQQAVANNAQYPRGIDLLFVSPSAIAGLPRSTTIRLLED